MLTNLVSSGKGFAAKAAGMGKIRFEFNLDKLVAVLAYFAGVGQIEDLTKLKAAKLLFYADKLHLLRFGRPITGDRYVSMDHGPVPSAGLEVMNRLVAPDEIQDAEQESVSRKLSAHKGFWAKHPHLRARIAVKEIKKYLSQSECDVLDEVITFYGSKPVGELIDLTHQEFAWLESDKTRLRGSSAPMPYESFFQGTTNAETTAMREYVEAQQEDRDFLSALAK
jgi:uncharacterized phage-associated protein